MIAVALAVQAEGQAQETKSPLVRQINNGNWPSDREAQQLVDELFYQRAIHT
jgi:hypothetical protein